MRSRMMLGGMALAAMAAGIGAVALVGASHPSAVERVAPTPSPAQKPAQPVAPETGKAMAATRREMADRIYRRTKLQAVFKHRAPGERAHRNWRRRKAAGKA